MKTYIIETGRGDKRDLLLGSLESWEVAQHFAKIVNAQNERNGGTERVLVLTEEQLMEHVSDGLRTRNMQQERVGIV